jgi:hypothetical protein
MIPFIPSSGFELAALALLVFFLMVKIIIDLLKNRGQNELVCSLREETENLNLLIQDLNSSMKVQNVLLDKIFQKVIQ